MMHDHMPMPSVDTWVGWGAGRLAVRAGGCVVVVVVIRCGSGSARGGATIDTGMMAALASDMFGRRIRNPRSAATMTATAAASICGTVALFSQRSYCRVDACAVAVSTVAVAITGRAAIMDGGKIHA